jgi:diguanylate cyclase (GGDEF)-like protein
LAGDACIRSVADRLQIHCKPISDIVACYGGEEFGIILPNTSANDAVSIAESIRLGVERLNIPHRTSTIQEHVILSIGTMCVTPDLRTTPSTIIALAVKALYESELSGRNRVTWKRHDTTSPQHIATVDNVITIIK